jgi:hypothetical protein
VSTHAHTSRPEPVVLLAALAWGTAFIHVLAAAHHYREWALYGVFFTVLAPAQAIWGGLVFQRPGDRRLLLVGGVVNLLVALVWAMSRTTGIPGGPDAVAAGDGGLARRDRHAERAGDGRDRGRPARAASVARV